MPGGAPCRRCPSRVISPHTGWIIGFKWLSGFLKGNHCNVILFFSLIFFHSVSSTFFRNFNIFGAGGRGFPLPFSLYFERVFAIRRAPTFFGMFVNKNR